MLIISLQIQNKFLPLHSKSLLQYVGQNSTTKTCQKVLRHSPPEPLLQKEVVNQWAFATCSLRTEASNDTLPCRVLPTSSLSISTTKKNKIYSLRHFAEHLEHIIEVTILMLYNENILILFILHCITSY